MTYVEKTRIDRSRILGAERSEALAAVCARRLMELLRPGEYPGPPRREGEQLLIPIHREEDESTTSVR